MKWSLIMKYTLKSLPRCPEGMGIIVVCHKVKVLNIDIEYRVNITYITYAKAWGLGSTP